MIKSIIVEDSELARIELTNLLSQNKLISIEGAAENGKEAIQLINKINPDLVFMDIHLPDMDGFEVLNTIHHIPQIIFTTAYDEYAIKSFEYNTLDYLLKPVKIERLNEAIKKAEKDIVEKPKRSIENSIFIKDSDKYSIAKLKDVQLFHTEGNYTKIFFNDQSPLLHKSLNQIENRLDPEFFFRINRQEIINIQHIVKVDKWFKGKLKLTLTSGKEVEVSDRQSVKLKQLLSF
ncbi:MAG: LytR/AlgR family response regulator transcription factor [Crocinitomicaceae bacterium]